MDEDQMVITASRRGARTSFLIRWLEREQRFDIAPMSSNVRLAVRSPALTVEHVLYALAHDRFFLGPEGREWGELFAWDRRLRAAVGDPTVVGDPAAGVIGVARPDGRRVYRLRTPPAGFRWRNTIERYAVRYTAGSVLAACAPITFNLWNNWSAKPPVEAAANQFIDKMFPAAPNLGWNVRAMQNWATTAVIDDTDPLRLARVDILLAQVAWVERETVATATTTLQTMLATDRRPVGRRPTMKPGRKTTDQRRPARRSPLRRDVPGTSL